MKLYSNIITRDDVRQAFRDAEHIDGADIYLEDSRTWKPRGYAHGVEFWAESLYGKRSTGRNQDGYGRGDGPRAASWTDYGYVIARLFNIDPHARIGSYDSEADFVEKVRRWVPRGESLKFLGALTNIGEYPAEFAVVRENGSPEVLERFDTEQNAARYIGTLPGHLRGAYGIDGPEQ